MTIGDEDDNARYIDAELLFESYLDRDSGVWSIRRITVSPPSCEASDEIDPSDESGKVTPMAGAAIDG